MQKTRVVITGVGIVTPLGLDTETSWSGILNCKSGIKKITHCDISFSPSKVAGTVAGSNGEPFDPMRSIEPRDVRKMDLFIQYGIDAATQAVEDSGWKPESQDAKDRTGLILGSGIGGLKMIEETSIAFHKLQNKKVSPYFIPASLINLLSGHVAIKYGFSGPNISAVTACSTGAHAIGDALRVIQYGDADVMVAGAAEAPVTPIGIAGFAAAKALSTKYNDNPESASRPWDRDRDGFVIGEGAGVVVLEEYSHAVARGAKIYAEVVGYGLTGDAWHITSPHPEGRGAYRAMKNALADAGVNAEQIDYINAHGTSTQLGDAIELEVVEKLFANRSNKKLMMSSTKSATGHLLGATGSVELIFSVLAMRDQIAPPTLNLYTPLESSIDLVPLQPKEAKLNYILSNSFGFGGTNASLLIKKV